MSGEMHIPLETAAELVASLGGADFPHKLWQWLHARIPLCHMSAARFNQAGADAVVQSVDWLFSHSEDGAEDSEPALLSYLEKHWRQDPLLSHITPLQDPQLVLIRHEDIAAQDYVDDVFRRHQISAECNLLGRAADGVYALALYRQRDQAAFALEELTLLRRLVVLLLPLLVQHARLTVSLRRSHLPSLPHLFDKRLATTGIRLSPREQAMCHCLLQGMSAQGAAVQLGVKESSCKTYIDRAFLKLGVKSKAQLYGWCLACV